MNSVKGALPNLVFGFGILAIGFTVVRTNRYLWISAFLYGIIAGGLRQLVWNLLDHATSWNWRDIALCTTGGFLALAMFVCAGLALPNHPFTISALILCGIVVAHKNRKKIQHA